MRGGCQSFCFFGFALYLYLYLHCSYLFTGWYFTGCGLVGVEEGQGGEVEGRWRFAMPTGGPSAHICTTLKTSTPRSTFRRHQC